MKSSNAHADKSTALCINDCCVSVGELAMLVNTLSRLLRFLEVSRECRVDPRFYAKLKMGEELAVNLVGRFTALISRYRSGIGNDVESYVNTISNFANGLVELRNIAKELLDETVSSSCRDVAEALNSIAIDIDVIGLKASAMLLALLGSLSQIPQSASGKIASSIGSMVFASLLSIHREKIRNSLQICYTDRKPEVRGV